MPNDIYMIDRAFPYFTSDVQAANVHASGIYIGGINCATDARKWSPAYAQGFKDAGIPMLPIYVGQNDCPPSNCDHSKLTMTQGLADGLDTISQAKKYGFNSGPLCLDVEYATAYLQGVHNYVEGWCIKVYGSGYLPVVYAPPKFILEHKPSVPIGIWYTLWVYDTPDGIEWLQTKAIKSILDAHNIHWYACLGWQYADRYKAEYDLSVMELRMFANFPGSLIMSGNGVYRYFDVTKHTIHGAFRDQWESLGNNSLATYGYPISEEVMLPTEDKTEHLSQVFERAIFHLINGQVVLARSGALYSQMMQFPQHYPDAFAPVNP